MRAAPAGSTFEPDLLGDGSAPAEALFWLRELYGLDLNAPGGLLGVLIGAVAKNWLPLFLVMPIFLPILIAAQSIGDERERRTLEPLLATPISTLEIIVGKSLAAVVPSLCITWLAAGVLCGGLDLLAAGRMAHAPIPDPSWLFGCLVLAPLLALFGNTLAVPLRRPRGPARGGAAAERREVVKAEDRYSRFSEAAIERTTARGESRMLKAAEAGLRCWKRRDVPCSPSCPRRRRIADHQPSIAPIRFLAI